MRWLSMGSWVALVGLGCGPQTAAPAPPEPVAAAPADDDDVRPGEVVHQYRGTPGDGDEESAGSDDDADDDEADIDGDEGADADAAASDDGRLDAAALRDRAEEAIDAEVDPDAPRVLSPLLPTEWPSTSGRVMVLVYPLAPMETGVTRYALGSPSHRVILDVGDGTSTVEALGKGKRLGTLEQKRQSAGDPIHRGEQALVEVVAGRSSPEKQRFALHAYGAWLDAHGEVGVDLEKKRAREFTKFVRSLGH